MIRETGQLLDQAGFKDIHVKKDSGRSDRVVYAVKAAEDGGKITMFDRLDDILIRYQQIMEELNDPDVVNDQKHFRKLMKEQRDRSLVRSIQNIRIQSRPTETVLRCLRWKTMKR